MVKGGNRNTAKLLMERSVPGRVGAVLPPLDVPEQPLPDAALLRNDLALPEVSEPEVVQYFTGLSQLNYSIDTHFYPLGSCTMKYNPKINDEVAFLPGFAGIHPLQPPELAQGALELLYRLQGFLQEITGMAGTSLATLAGAHGELAGVLMMRAYHQARGDAPRHHGHWRVEASQRAQIHLPVVQLFDAQHPQPGRLDPLQLHERRTLSQQPGSRLRLPE